MAMISRRWVQLNVDRSAVTISRSGKTSAKRSCRRSGWVFRRLCTQRVHNRRAAPLLGERELLAPEVDIEKDLSFTRFVSTDPKRLEGMVANLGERAEKAARDAEITDRSRSSLRSRN